ncbi:hypothetical protein BRC83_07220 [Halobacteriales archaeon QS_1_68_17]|nr:MAG: hypothetical protein BRC83_07220 [Halobacteriales archaeon QS_1_68_17]
MTVPLAAGTVATTYALLGRTGDRSRGRPLFVSFVGGTVAGSLAAAGVGAAVPLGSAGVALRALAFLAGFAAVAWLVVRR